jgi:hypothetical protein
MGRLYGILAEFDSAEKLLNCARRAHRQGYRRMDGYSPYPVEELAEEIGSHRTKVPAVTLAGGIVGGLTGFFMQYYSAVYHYPIDVGGRPFDSWPSFIVITFELTILFAGLSSAFGMLALNGLPCPHHALFAVPRFSQVTDDRFFFCIEAMDPQFDTDKVIAFFEAQEPAGVYQVDATA